MMRKMTHALVIDDEASCRRVVARFLQRLGYTVFVADGAAAARRDFAPGRFGLVVSDVGLGDGDGVGLAGELRRLDPHVAIIIASGDPSNVERAREAGFACLAKPFDADQLRAVLAAKQES